MQGVRARLVALAGAKLRAPLPAGGKKGVKDRGERKTGELSSEVVTGLSIKKGESDPPIKPDSEYPDWLFKLLEPQPTVAELQRLYEGPGLTLEQMKRLFRYKNKLRIKEGNTSRAKH